MVYLYSIPIVHNGCLFLLSDIITRKKDTMNNNLMTIKLFITIKN